MHTVVTVFFTKVPVVFRTHLKQLESDARNPLVGWASDHPRAHFCIPCLGRGYQLKEVLHWNLLCAQPYQGIMSFFLVIFNDDSRHGETRELLDWLLVYAREALQTGFLRVAVAQMQYWSAPEGKNIAHRFAMEATRGDSVPRDRVFLVNLDADNGFSHLFCKGVLNDLRTCPRRTLVQYRGLDGGVTGRMGYWASDFAQIGGYDEKLKGAGHQDVDLRSRFDRIGGWAVRRGYQPSGEKYSAGWSVPNDPDPKVAINQAKVKYVDPELKFKSWGQLDGRNKTIAGSQTETKRNSERQFTELGVPWVEVEWPWVRGAAPPAPG